jgi:XRE family transcriptional regulator, aerobic/anaerobic benzoate catabolism transcriptional regulator
VSSTILQSRPSEADHTAFAPEPGAKHPFLVSLGERTRALRTRRGLTRKALSQAADVSERHLANLEYGVGNVSVLVLLQVAQALDCSLVELLGGPASGAHAARSGAGGAGARRASRVALIGLRGAGKSTLGALLAEDLGFPFVELSREVERLAGGATGEIQALYGQAAYRRYERRALEETIRLHDEAVIAVLGGLVSEPATFELLLGSCTTVWLQAAPEHHMARVRAQGDLRPMAASSEAMADLKAILAARSAFYAKAQFSIDTSAQALDATFAELRRRVRGALALEV